MCVGMIFWASILDLRQIDVNRMDLPKWSAMRNDALTRSYCSMRSVRAEKIGGLGVITGQVVRTHPVHPELVAGTFRCLDCQTVNPNVQQQYKYTIPTVCRNPVCSNRTRFSLEIRSSSFIDFQKIRVQEMQDELPRGAIPRT